MAKRTINGFIVDIVPSCYRASDGSSGDRRANGGCGDDERETYSARISNRWHYITALAPFDDETDALKAARKWTVDQKAHRLFR